jgi:hypothetical protein
MRIIRRHWGWILPFIAACLLCYAISEYVRWSSYNSLRTSQHQTYEAIDHKPVKDMQLECPSELPEGDTVTIRATLTNDGPTASFEFRVWPNFDLSHPANCLQYAAIEHGQTYAFECNVDTALLRESAVETDESYRPPGIVVWALSSEDHNVQIGPSQNSYRAVCLIPEIPVTNPYSESQAVGLTLIGIGFMVAFVLWLMRRKRSLSNGNNSG